MCDRRWLAVAAMIDCAVAYRGKKEWLEYSSYGGGVVDGRRSPLETK